MHILREVNGQQFGDIVDNHIIHTELHGAKQMMCQMQDVYLLDLSHTTTPGALHRPDYGQTAPKRQRSTCVVPTRVHVKHRRPD